MNARELRPVRLSALLSFASFQTVLLVITGLVALCFLLQVVRFLPVVADNLYPEAAGILAAHRWSHGLPLYQDYRLSPYLITPYPPLWYAVLALAAKLGLSDLNSLTLFGRMLSLACLFGMLALAYRWNRRIGMTARLALLAPAFYLTFPILIPWGVAARPDFPALFCGFLALYWVGRGSTTSSLCIAAAIAAAAFLVRHNAVAAPVSAVLWLAWCRRWKDAGLFCAVWAMIVGVTLAAVQYSSHGMLLLNLSGGAFGNFAPTYIRDTLGRLLITAGHGYAIALFAFAAFAFLESWKARDEQTRLLTFYMAITLLMAVVGSAARGAAVNHYLEPALAMATLVPSGLARLQACWKTDSPFVSFAFAIVLLVLLPSLDMQRSYLAHNRPDNLKAFLPLVENKDIFTDIPFLAARSSALQLLEPASLTNTERAREGVRWSSAQIATALEAKKYELVILSFPIDFPYPATTAYPRYVHLDATVRAAIARNYGFCFASETSNVDGASETRYIYGPLSDEQNMEHANCPVIEPALVVGRQTQHIAGH